MPHPQDGVISNVIQRRYEMKEYHYVQIHMGSCSFIITRGTDFASIKKDYVIQVSLFCYETEGQWFYMVSSDSEVLSLHLSKFDYTILPLEDRP